MGSSPLKLQQVICWCVYSHLTYVIHIYLCVYVLSFTKETHCQGTCPWLKGLKSAGSGWGWEVGFGSILAPSLLWVLEPVTPGVALAYTCLTCLWHIPSQCSTGTPSLHWILDFALETAAQFAWQANVERPAGGSLLLPVTLNKYVTKLFFYSLSVSSFSLCVCFVLEDSSSQADAKVTGEPGVP